MKNLSDSWFHWLCDGVTAVDNDDYTVVACAESHILKFLKKVKMLF